MGTWGPGLYSDDTACDVRDDYKDILGDGIEEPEATKKILEAWKSELNDIDTAPVFWLTLADVQWKLGRLQPDVKREAIKVIESGADLTRWSENKKYASQRQAILAVLLKKLHSGQPPIKKVRKRFVQSTDWCLGNVYRYEFITGQYILFHVIGFHEDKGGRGPVCEILDWNNKTTLNQKRILKLGYKHAIAPQQHLSQFLLGSLGPRDYPKDRISLIAENITLKQKVGGYACLFWRYMDQQLEKLFGLKIK
jgi:hypothetical protein